MDRFGSVHKQYISSVRWPDFGYLWFIVVDCEDDDDDGSGVFIQLLLTLDTLHQNEINLTCVS